MPISTIRHTHSTATPRADAAGSNRRTRKRGGPRESLPSTVFRIGHSVIRPRSPLQQHQPGRGQSDEPERPVNLVIHEPVVGAHEGNQTSPS